MLMTACGQPGSSICSAETSAEYAVAKLQCWDEFGRTENVAVLTALIELITTHQQFSDLTEIDKAAEQLEPSQRGELLVQIANQLRAQGQDDLAYSYQQQAVEVFRAGNEHKALLSSLEQLTNHAWRRTDYPTALALVAESLGLAEQAQENRYMDSALRDLTNILLDIGSLEMAEQVLSVRRQRVSGLPPIRQVGVFFNQGMLELDRQNYGLANHQFELALQAATGTKNRAGLRALYINLAYTQARLGDFEQAEQYLDKAWENANSDGSGRYGLLFLRAYLERQTGDAAAAGVTLAEALAEPDLPLTWHWEMHYSKGLAEEQLGDLPAAQESFLASIDALEQFRGELGFGRLKSQLSATTRQPYETLFTLLMQDQQVEPALDVLERAKSRDLLDAYAGATVVPALPKVSSTALQQVANDLGAVRRYLNTLRRSYNSELKPVSQIMDSLVSTVVLLHFRAGEQLWVGRVGQGKLILRPASVSSAELDQLLIDYRRENRYAATLAELGEVLFPEDLLPESGTHLYVIPDQSLAAVMLPGLRVQGQYLIQRHSLSLLPSLNALVTLGQQSARPVGGSLVIGDPLSDLPFASAEAVMVAQQLGVNAHVGDSADTALLDEHGPVGLLHVASHTGIDPTGPWLQLADRRFSAGELLGDKLAPRLAFLASCASGASQDGNLWGSLGGLFLNAGSKAVVVAMRSVRDHITAELVRDFYAAYSSGSSAAMALALAQRQAIQRGIPAQQWAPFVLIGEIGQH